MTTLSLLLVLLLIAAVPPTCVALGGSSAATLAVVYGGSSAAAVCTISAYQPIQTIQCFSNGRTLTVPPTTSAFTAIAGGQDTLCAARSGGATLLCYNTTSFAPKRIYNSASHPLTRVAIGSTQICGLTRNTRPNVICWRGNEFPTSGNLNGSSLFDEVSSGLSFSCGVLDNTTRVLCWGGGGSDEVQLGFANRSMSNVEVGGKFACGIDETGQVICVGNNDHGQLNVPSHTPFEFRALTLGANHSCAIRRLNRTVVCWGAFSSAIVDSVSFELIVAGLNFTCGLVTRNFTVLCWGPGWVHSSGNELPLSKSLPGPCVFTACECNVYPESDSLCAGNGHVCRPCDVPTILPDLQSQPEWYHSPSSSSKRLRKGLLIFAIVGSVGGFCGICTVIYLMWTGICFGKKKIHNSVQPTITNANNAQQSNSSPPSRSSTLRRQGSILMRRQRSGTSSTKHAERAEEFSFADLVRATNDFAMENKIGSGSFGVVYRGKLTDGREVAIKRSELGKKFQEKERAFESELAFLSRLHHKHLVRLVGYCEERDERLLVYEYMKNGALYDHLHNIEKSMSFVNSWRTRIKIALDAARGIEYLHNYAVPPIIHRDIKSSNILLDDDWTARVSDFGLSLMGPSDNDRKYGPTRTAGTVGYIDPEYYGLNVLTAKSDVYGLGVVLLELLTGKRAIFKSNEDGGVPMSVVDYAVPVIKSGELSRVLDPRVGPPETGESDAVELVAYTAMHCVHLEGKDRPTMSDIVANLERALVLCGDDHSHGSISSGIVSIVSD